MAQMQRPHQRKVTGSTMGALLAPGLENERSSRRRGAPAKNHARENVLAIRDAQRANRERREEEEQKKAKVFKMKKFENVASRLMDAPRPRGTPRDQAGSGSGSGSGGNATSSPPTSARCGGDEGGEGPRPSNFLRRGARESKPTPAEVHEKRLSKAEKPRFLHESGADDARPRTPRKEAVPRSGETLALAERNDVCHIAKNRTKATRLEPPKRATDARKTRSPAKHDAFGTVPAYLDERKRQLRTEAEAAKQALPDPDCPPGMTKMDDDERKDALQALKVRRKEIKDDLFKMPLNVTTVRMKMRQDALHKQLDDVEKSMTIFERDVVYIQA